MNISCRYFKVFFLIAIFGLLNCCSSTPRPQPEAQVRVSKSKKHLSTTKLQRIQYNRQLYKHWIDADKDCQNTRAEILIQTSLIKPKFKPPKECVVISGKWFDPYSGKYFTKANQVDIDHIAPLKYAHEHGGNGWHKKKRQDFANDFENLIVVSASLNRQKGAKGPQEWLPPNKSYHCEYLQRWQYVHKKYQLKPSKRQMASLSIEDMTTRACKN